MYEFIIIVKKEKNLIGHLLRMKRNSIQFLENWINKRKESSIYLAYSTSAG